jgi:ABC-type branched-subunit amino acid transport system ATPase component
VEQNAKQALEIADKGYVLVDGANKVEGSGQDLINDRNVARMFLGSKE